MKTFVLPGKKRVHLSLVVVFLSSIIALIVMAESTGATTTSEAKVYIVYTEKPTGNKDPKVVHLRTLTSVLGSAEAAKNALVYTYKNAATGFAAKLTPEQAAVMSKQPCVFKVELSKTFHLNKASGVGGFRPH